MFLLKINREILPINVAGFLVVLNSFIKTLKMKKLFFLLFIICILPVHGQTEKKITILFTNDLHSRVTGYAPESDYTPLTPNDDKTIGGFARIASIINEEKSKSDGIMLVVDAGDFLMGTLFQALEPETGFQLGLMKAMGYDVVAIGNHEFDLGPGKLADIVSSAKSRGDIPEILLGNAVFNKEDTGDDSLEKLFNDNIIGRKFVLEKDGLRIGLFSLMGKVADENAAYAPPVKFSNQIKVAKKLVKELQNEKCNLIICLSHSGVSKEKDGSWGGEDVKLAEKVKGIDVIISGHTHTKLDEPVMVNGTPVVQSGEYSQFVGRLTLSYTPDNVKVAGYTLLPVDDHIVGDKVVNRLIEEQKKSVTEKILKPLGMDYNTPVAETDFLLECNEMGDIEGSNLGPMVADAIYKYVNENVVTGTDFAMVAVGVIRDKIVPGIQTSPDIFRIMSMGSGEDGVPGYPLSRLYVTGRELKNILEILQVAKSTPANYCYYSGLKVDYDPEMGLLKKIKKVEIVKPDGTTRLVDFSKKNRTLYSVTANSYMLEFIGIIKKMSFGLINVVPKDATDKPVKDMKTAILDMDEKSEGLQEGKEWLSIIWLLRSMKDTNGNGIPDIDRKYSTPVKSFFTVTTR
jgi:5'-nucleotidase / UDP-sugar diphosphatase